MCKWLIKRRLNSTEIILHVEILYKSIATKSEFVTSVKLPSHLFIFKTLLIELKLSNRPQVNAKDFFCPLEVLKFVHSPTFYRAMRVYSG